MPITQDIIMIGDGVLLCNQGVARDGPHGPHCFCNLPATCIWPPICPLTCSIGPGGGTVRIAHVPSGDTIAIYSFTFSYSKPMLYQGGSQAPGYRAYRFLGQTGIIGNLNIATSGWGSMNIYATIEEAEASGEVPVAWDQMLAGSGFASIFCGDFGSPNNPNIRFSATWGWGVRRTPFGGSNHILDQGTFGVCSYWQQRTTDCPLSGSWDFQPNSCSTCIFGGWCGTLNAASWPLVFA